MNVMGYFFGFSSRYFKAVEMLVKRYYYLYFERERGVVLYRIVYVETVFYR